MRKRRGQRGPKKTTISLQLQKALDELETTPELSFESLEEELEPQQPTSDMAARSDTKEKEMKSWEETVRANILKEISKDLQQQFAKMNSTIQNNFSTMEGNLSMKIDKSCGEVKELYVALKQQFKDLESSTAKEMESMRREYNNKHDILLKQLTDTERLMEEMEGEMEQMSQEITGLKKQHDTNWQLTNKLNEKCQDLEARSRRQNLRLVGIKEGAEHSLQMRDFITNLLKDVFKLPEKPKIDLAHRVGRLQKHDNAKPRQIIVKFLDISTVETLLKKIKYGENLTFADNIVRFYRDYPREILEKRREFKTASSVLYGHSEVRYGVIYPAKMLITLKGKQRSFTDPDAACKYAEEILNKIQSGSD